MDDRNAGDLGRLFAGDLKMNVDTHEARTALGSVLLALRQSVPEPDDWIYDADGGPLGGRPRALLLAGDRLIEVNVGWEGSGPAEVKVRCRGLTDEGVVIEMGWRGATIENEMLHHATTWTFEFPDGERVVVAGLIRTLPGENEMLDDGEQFAREVASRLGRRLT